MDLSLLRQGIGLGLDYGLHSLEELARLGAFLEHTVYESGSLRVEEGRAVFTLLNPPLRMGAFSGVRVLWDGSAIPPAEVVVAREGYPKVEPSEIDRDHPFTIPVGSRTHFRLHAATPDPAHHRIRLELQSVAIPPKVWFEFTDILRPERTP
jgi:hypothetical protein